MARKTLLILLAGAGLATAWVWAATFRGYHGRFVLGTGWQLVVAPARMVVIRDGPGAPQPLRAPLGSVSPPRLRVSPGGGWQAEIPYWIILMATASLCGIALLLPSGGRKEQRCRVCGGRLRQRRCERCHPPVKHSAGAY